MIPNHTEHRRYGERVSTGFVESTVNTVVGKRFCKRQQMRWSKTGAHLMLHTRTRTLDGTLRGKFEQWYPGLPSKTLSLIAPRFGVLSHINMLGEYDFSDEKLRDAAGILPLKSAA